jgi:hypothetical protein
MAPFDKLDAVIAECTSLVPSRQIRGELEAEAVQVAEKLDLVGEDSHGNVLNRRKGPQELV